MQILLLDRRAWMLGIGRIDIRQIDLARLAFGGADRTCSIVRWPSVRIPSAPPGSPPERRRFPVPKLYDIIA